MSLGAPIQSLTVSDQAFERLVDAITRGELQPGDAVNEVELSSRLGISRGSLREAMRRLEERGLMVRTPRRGVRVASVSNSDLLEILDMREVLEGMACRLATERMSDAELGRLEAKLREHAETPELATGQAYFQSAGDQDIHFLIAKGSGNERLARLLCDELYFLMRIYRFRSSERPGRAHLALDEHRAILEAMQSRDPDRAEQAMRRHIRRSRQNIEAEILSGAAENAPDVPATIIKKG